MWNKVSLGEIVKNLDNRRIPLNSIEREKKSGQKLYPYIGANNIKEYIGEYIFDEKILCVAEDGGNWGQGEVCAVIYEGKTWVNNHAHVLVENGKAKLEYLRYFLNETDLSKYITGTTRGKLTRSALDSIHVPLPPIEQQIQIANTLSKSEALINHRKVSIRILDAFLNSTFLKMFGDPILNPKKFNKNTLFEYFIVEPQNGLYKPATAYGSGVKILRIDSFYDGKVIGLDKLKRLEVSQEELEKYALRKDEIVINRVNSREYLGKVGLIPKLEEAAVFESNMMRFSIDISRLNPVYLIKLLSSKYVKQQILRCAKDAVNQSSINQQDVKSLEILVPPLELQTEFAHIVEKTETLKTLYQKSLHEIEDLYASLSQRAFKGELQSKSDTKVVPIQIDEKEDDYFKKRKALACYIINQSLDDDKFGDTKFEKLLFLSDYNAIKRNFGQHYYQKVVGPYDNTFTNTFYIQIQKSKLFRRKRGEGQTVFLTGANHYKSVTANDYFSDQELKQVDRLINIFKKSDYEKPEIVATLYAVWNNRIIRQQQIANGLLKEDFLKWDAKKTKYKGRLDAALAWMQKENIVPDGWGKIVDKPKEKRRK